MENPWFRFVLLLDFAGDFEDEDADENEEEDGSGYFSYRLFTPLPRWIVRRPSERSGSRKVRTLKRPEGRAPGAFLVVRRNTDLRGLNDIDLCSDHSGFHNSL